MTGPDLARLLAAQSNDQTGQALAALVRAARGESGAAAPPSANGQASAPLPTPAQFMAQGAPSSRPWNDVPATLAAAGRNNGVMRLAASLREMTALSVDEAIAYMYEHAWPLINQHQGGHGFPESEFEEVIRAVWRQYPGAAERIEQAVAATADLAVHPLPGSPLELTDAYITDRAAFVLQGRFCWARGLGWMKWNNRYWAQADESEIWDDLRKYFIWLLGQVAGQPGADQAMLGRLTALLTSARIRAVTGLCRGHLMVLREPEAFDRNPDLLNTPNGVVSLRDGSVRLHDAHLMMTKITRGSYRPGFAHPDWEQALTALDAPERAWYQARVGQAVTGYPPSDGVMVVLQGGGENGKSACTSDGPVKALGDYADMASPKLITQHRPGASEHSTEMADLRGQRLLIGEELSEGRSIDVTALKRIQDVGRIKARYVHKDNITFDASHTLMVTTNYVPVITETDHGTWRRLALLRFQYSYKKPGEPLVATTDRRGDPGLKGRIKNGADGQHDAIVTWAVDGAVAWYADGQVATPPTKQVIEDTREWRVNADHIMGFWDEFLEGDLGRPDGHPPCIAASHLLAVFNVWLGKNGHTAWTHQTFAMRFGSHEETLAKGVSYQTTMRLDRISYWRENSSQQPADPPSGQLRAWVGVKFRNRDDQGGRGLVDEVDGGRANPPMKEEFERFVQPASTASTPVFPQVNLVREGAFEKTAGQRGSPSSTPPPAPREFAQPLSSPSTKNGLTLAIDLETGSADELFRYTQSDERGFVRLAGVIGPAGTPLIMSGPELLGLLEHATVIEGHNVLGFDLVVLARHHGADYLRLAARARDTELIARQARPPRSKESGQSEDKYDLDHVAAGLGVTGKINSIRELARKHGGFDKIPLDDTEFRSYLEGDLRATQAVSAAMAVTYPPDPYVVREHKLAAIAGQMTLNGFAVDQQLLAERLAAGQGRKREALELLHAGWGLPLTKTVWRGRGEAKTATEEPVTSPLSTDAGRAWLAQQYERYGITDPPTTAKAGKLALGAEDLKRLLNDPRTDGSLRSMLVLMGAVTATRTVYQTAADCLTSEGRVHPGNSFRQASGRWSVTNPGLTVFGKRGGKHVERDIFLPDEGHVLLSFDLSQVDMRSMAGHSQDPNYLAIFQGNRDAHQEIADQVGVSRQDAKAIGHGWNYGLGAKRMIANGLDPEKVYKFIEGMEQRFPQLISWREQIREQGKAGAILDNGWGRRMACDPQRAYTVAPALMGQGGARDIMGECLLRLPSEILPMLRVMVHDEILCSVPKEQVYDVIPVVKKAMTWEWTPNTGGIPVPITCDFAFGASWGECSAH